MEAMTMVRKNKEEREEEGNERRRKTKIGGKDTEKWGLVPGLQIKAGSEQQLQAGPPSTCCCPTAKSNTLFQQTHCLMASVERPLLGPWLPLQTLRVRRLHQNTHTEIHKGSLKLLHIHCLHRVTRPGEHTHTDTTFLRVIHQIILLHICSRMD